MAEWVALASVISSGLVALGGIVVTYRNGKEQRRHDAALAYEGRAWAKKSEGLFEVIRAARVIVDILTAPLPSGREQIAFRATGILADLDAQVPVVEAYGSTEAITAFHSLRDLLRPVREPIVEQMKLARVRADKENAIDRQDFDGAVRLREEERSVQAAAVQHMGIDLDDLQARAETLIAAARVSVRGSAPSAPSAPKRRMLGRG